MISHQIMDDLNGVVDDFKRVGSPSLVTAIQQEEGAPTLPSFANLPMDQALSHDQRRIV